MLIGRRQGPADLAGLKERERCDALHIYYVLVFVALCASCGVVKPVDGFLGCDLDPDE